MSSLFLTESVDRLDTNEASVFIPCMSDDMVDYKVGRRLGGLRLSGSGFELGLQKSRHKITLEFVTQQGNNLQHGIAQNARRRDH